ncbi:glutamate receptor [Tropilaelaps mercedesae]|uniref:Glutamate receptor n=1 Tax=Tropilaelaps mercedesae TaxID=418985 RepID=A0A1V9XVR4_9ACAR|nr:glutamate receptor [Tropilaelaps mercedesae]
MMREGVLAFVVAPDAAPALREMLTSYSSHFHIPWSQVAYIFDDSASPDILEAIQNSGVKISIAKKVNNEAEASDAVLELSSLGRLKPEKIEKIVLNVNRPSLGKTVLSGMIREVKSFKNLNTQFILANPVSDDFWQYIRFRDAGSSLNVTAFRLVDSELPHVTRFHKQMMQLSSHRSLFHNQGTQSYLFLDAVTALLTGFERVLKDNPRLLDRNLRHHLGSVYFNGTKGLDCMDQSRFFEYGDILAAFMKQVKISQGQSGPVEFRDNGERVQPTITVIQGSHKGHVRLGTWTAKKGLMLADKPEALPQIKAPGAITPAKELSVASVLNSPYLIQRQTDGEFSGFVPDFLEALSNIVPFAYKIQAARHHDYGRRFENGTWNGLMAEVVNKKVEIAVSDMALTAERQESVEFTQPFFVDDLAVVMSRTTPAGRPSLSFFFVRVFSWQLWACVAAILAVFVIFSYILNHLAQTRQRNSAEKNRLSGLVWFTLASVFARSQGPHVNSKAYKILLASWWLFLAVMTITYISACIALLQAVLFGSGPDLFNKDKFGRDAANGVVDVGYVRHGAVEKMIKNQAETQLSFYAQLLNTSRTRIVSGIAEGIRHVGPNFAFLGLKSQVDSYIGRDCGVKSYTLIPQFAQYALIMPKMSPYRDMFNQGIEKLRESGVLADLKEKWIDTLIRCPHEIEVLEVPAPIRYTALCGMFIVVLAGFILALLAGVVEFCWSAKHDSSKSEKPIQKVMWDKAHDSLKPFTQKDPALGNDEEMTLNPSQANGTPKQVRVMV